MTFTPNIALQPLHFAKSSNPYTPQLLTMLSIINILLALNLPHSLQSMFLLSFYNIALKIILNPTVHGTSAQSVPLTCSSNHWLFIAKHHPHNPPQPSPNFPCNNCPFSLLTQPQPCPWHPLGQLPSKIPCDHHLKSLASITLGTLLQLPLWTHLIFFTIGTYLAKTPLQSVPITIPESIVPDNFLGPIALIYNMQKNTPCIHSIPTTSLLSTISCDCCPQDSLTTPLF